jgi:hypothetical protein
VDEELRARRDASIARLEELTRTGRRIRETAAAAATAAWQNDCAAAVSELSGGSKAHWLSRAYSDALLVRRPDGHVLVEADPMEIVDRILAVLREGAVSLARLGDDLSATTGAPRPRRFGFVADAGLRPVLEQAYTDCQDALARGDSGQALVLACGILEALLTDALARARPDGAAARADWPFERRIAEAERAGIVRGGCSRLPASARRYRDLTDEAGEVLPGAAVSEGEARVAVQVLRVVMRDLDPGR